MGVTGLVVNGSSDLRLFDSGWGVGSVETRESRTGDDGVNHNGFLIKLWLGGHRRPAILDGALYPSLVIGGFYFWRKESFLHWG